MYTFDEYVFFCSLFPHGNHNNKDMRISHVKMEDKPEGEILDSFEEGDRIFYLVEKDGHIAIIRVCEAMEGSGYEAFVVLHDSTMNWYFNNENGIREKFKSWKNALARK